MMRDAQFDKRMMERAKNEQFSASVEAKETLQRAMRAGAAAANRSKNGKSRWMIALAATVCAAAAMLLLFTFAPVDQIKGRGILPAVDEIAAQISPAEGLTRIIEHEPNIYLSAMVDHDRIEVEASFSNWTDDIWLIAWGCSQPDQTEIDMVGDPIWLECGTSFEEALSWDFVQTSENLPQFQACYEGYRVTAQMLHWMEGEWLSRGEDRYEEQQALIEDAFNAGALILSPGDWPEGDCGRMQLILPDRYMEAHPDITPLRYYTQAGMLELVLEKEETLHSWSLEQLNSL